MEWVSFCDFPDEQVFSDIHRERVHYRSRAATHAIRQKTGYVIKLVEAYGVGPKRMGVLASEQFEQLQKDHPGSKGIIVVIFGTASDGAALKTSETLSARFPKQRVEAKLGAILQGQSSHVSTIERIVHVLLEHLDLWFYVLDPSRTSIFLVRYPTAEMILLVFAPVLGLLTGISSIAFTPVRYLRQWSRFGVCGLVGLFVVVVFALIVRQPGGIYPGMFAYALGVGFIISAMVGLLKKFWVNERFKGRQPGGWWNGPVHFRNR